MERELARETLLRHSRSPRNGELPILYSHTQTLQNPICGDLVELRILLLDERIDALGFAVKGCAICAASASLMCEHVNGVSIAAAIEAVAKFEEALTDSELGTWPDDLAHLESLSFLSRNPARRACAILPWLALSKCVR